MKETLIHDFWTFQRMCIVLLLEKSCMRPPEGTLQNQKAMSCMIVVNRLILLGLLNVLYLVQ